MSTRGASGKAEEQVTHAQPPKHAHKAPTRHRAAQKGSVCSTLSPSTGVQVPEGPAAAQVPGQGPVSPWHWEQQAGEGQERCQEVTFSSRAGTESGTESLLTSLSPLHLQLPRAGAEAALSTRSHGEG